MAVQFFLKTIFTSKNHDEVTRLTARMIGEDGANIMEIRSKWPGSRITLSAHRYMNSGGEEVEAPGKLIAIIESHDELIAENVVTDLLVLKRKYTAQYFVKTFSVGNEYDASRLVRKMIGVNGSNICAVNQKTGTRITLSAHRFLNVYGEELEAPGKIIAAIRAKDEGIARNAVEELLALKEACENPYILTWTPTNKHAGFFIGRNGTKIKEFNKKHNVYCRYDNEAHQFIIESIERKKTLEALNALERMDIERMDIERVDVRRNTNPFAILADAENIPQMINLDLVQSAPEKEEFPSIGTVPYPVTPRGKWSAQREDTMSAITAVPVPPPAPKKAPRPQKLTINKPVMHNLDDEDLATSPKKELQWWDDDEEEEEEDLDGLGPVIKRQTSLQTGTETEGFGPWRRGEAPDGVITLPCLLQDGSIGEGLLRMPE